MPSFRIRLELIREYAEALLALCDPAVIPTIERRVLIGRVHRTLASHVRHLVNGHRVPPAAGSRLDRKHALPAHPVICVMPDRLQEYAP